jgi:hypothetical protein
MNRKRKMLLSVTATSMTAVVVGCATAQPVGTVAQPPHDQVADAAVSPDVEQVPSDEANHTVGTVAAPPDKK